MTMDLKSTTTVGADSTLSNVMARFTIATLRGTDCCLIDTVDPSNDY